jgi:hypothetical protein
LYNWDEPLLAEACHKLEIRQVKEQFWRETRRSASLALVIVIPLLMVVLAVSFEYLTRRQVSGRWSVLVVCLLGGLLGGVLICTARLAQQASVRVAPERWSEGVLWLLVPPLLTGAAAGAASGFAVMNLGGHDVYNPQTLYLIALVCSLVLSRFTQVVASDVGIGSSASRGQAS